MTAFALGLLLATIVVHLIYFILRNRHGHPLALRGRRPPPHPRRRRDRLRSGGIGPGINHEPPALTETDCSRAEKVCPQRLAIADLMTDAVRLLAQKPPGEGFLAGMRWF